MAFAHYVAAAASVEASTSSTIQTSDISAPSLSPVFKWPFKFKTLNLSLLSGLRRTGRHSVKNKVQESEVIDDLDAFTHLKHLLLPIMDRNPYLSEGTRQALATTAELANKYGAGITVVVIDEKSKELLPEHETQLASIRWHLFEGGFQKFGLLEKLGEGSQPTAIIGELANDLGLDLVVLSMEAIHSKHVDANLLAKSIPCSVLLLP